MSRHNVGDFCDSRVWVNPETRTWNCAGTTVAAQTDMRHGDGT